MTIEKLANGNVLIKDADGNIENSIPASSTIFVQPHPRGEKAFILSQHIDGQHEDESTVIYFDNVTSMIDNAVALTMPTDLNGMITMLSESFFFDAGGSSSGDSSGLTATQSQDLADNTAARHTPETKASVEALGVSYTSLADKPEIPVKVTENFSGALSGITDVDNQKAFEQIDADVPKSLINYLDALGKVKSGFQLSMKTGLEFDLTSGAFTSIETTPTRQVKIEPVAAKSTVSFRYMERDGTVSAPVTALNPLLYNNTGGNTAAVPGDDTCLHRVYVRPSDGDVVVLRAQTKYTSFNQALQRAFSETPTIPAALNDYYMIATILLRGNIANRFDNPSYIRIYPTSRLGEALPSGATSASTDLSLFFLNAIDRNAATGLVNGNFVHVEDDDGAGNNALYYINDLADGTWTNAGKIKLFPQEASSNSVLAPLAKGLEIEASPDYDGPILVNVSATPTQEILTGIDLNDVDLLYFSITNNNTGEETRKVDLRTFKYDVNQGGLIHWWDAVGIRLRINLADKSTGRLLVAYLGGTEIRIEKISFKKIVDVVPQVQELTITDSTLNNTSWANNPLGIGDLTSDDLVGSYLMLRWVAVGLEHWQRFDLPFSTSVEQIGSIRRALNAWTIRARVDVSSGVDVLKVAQSVTSGTSGASNLTAIRFFPLGASVPTSSGSNAKYKQQGPLYATAGFLQKTGSQDYTFFEGDKQISDWTIIVQNGSELTQDSIGVLTHTGGSASTWTTGASSSKEVKSAKHTITTPPSGGADGRFMFGLHDVQSVPAISFQFKYALYVIENAYRVYESGTHITAAQQNVTPAAGDELEVRVNQETEKVEYVLNGNVFWTSGQDVDFAEGGIQDLHLRVEELENKIYTSIECDTGVKWVNGKKVYRQVVSGPLANATTAYVPLKTDAGIDMPASGYLDEVMPTSSFVASEDGSDNNYLTHQNFTTGVSDNGTVKSAFHSPSGDWSSYTGTWIVEYTKV